MNHQAIKDALGLIHISFAGPVYRITCGKWKWFEDHHYCGPIFVGESGDPLGTQPAERDPVWNHVNAWYQQGKRFVEVSGVRWAQYQTKLSRNRAATRAAAAIGKEKSK